MSIDLKQFSGFMNTDDSNEVIGSSHHKFAKNGRFRQGRFESIEGTNEIIFERPDGYNECIGAFFDEKNQIIYWFNYNSNSIHGIYQCNS